MTTQKERQEWVVEATAYLRRNASVPLPPKNKLRERTQAKENSK